MPSELRTSFDFYQRNNEQHQFAELCVTVRDSDNLFQKRANLHMICKPHYVEYIETERYFAKAAVLFNSIVG
jgi:hypothetical protein